MQRKNIRKGVIGRDKGTICRMVDKEQGGADGISSDQKYRDRGRYWIVCSILKICRVEYLYGISRVALGFIFEQYAI